MIVYVNEEIESGDQIEIEFSADGGVMSAKKDFAVVIKAIGGHTGAADVTMSLSVYADIFPPAHDVDGSVVDTEAWTNVTWAGYRLDGGNGTIDAPALDFTGVDEETAFVDFDNLNADRVKFVIEFDDVPSGTPAQLTIKVRRDKI